MGTRPQWLGILKAKRSTFIHDCTEEERATVGRHFAYLQDLLKQGNLVLAGRTQDEEPIGLMIFEAEDRQAAETIMASDPAVMEGVFTSELRPYAVAVSVPLP